MPKKMLPLELSAEEELQLRMWLSAGKTEQRLARRAKVILLATEQLTLDQISERSGMSRNICWKWRRRFLKDRIEGLLDKPRPGRPAVISPETKLEVIRLASTKPKDKTQNWDYRRLARRVGVSSTTVHRILNQADLKPHKVDYWCGVSPDPEFEAKQVEILGLYLDPPENALVLSVDEKSQIQALDRTQPELPMKPGRPRRQTNTYKRHGTTCLLAALAVHEGTIEGRCVDRQRHQEFLSFLKHLYRKHPHRQLHVILDNLSAHKARAVKDWVSKRRRLRLHFTPTYASWLNQIEIWFSIFSRKVIRGAVWSSKQELVGAIMAYIKRYNEEQAKPFQWTYTGKPLVA